MKKTTFLETLWDTIKLFFSVYFKTLNDLLGGFKFINDLAEVMAYVTVFIGIAILTGIVICGSFVLIAILVG